MPTRSKVGRDHRGSGPTSLLKEAIPEHMARCPDGSWISPVRETPLCSNAHGKEVLPHVQVELPVHQFLLIASCPIAGHP